jgi:hypothetical protein
MLAKCSQIDFSRDSEASSEVDSQDEDENRFLVIEAGNEYLLQTGMVESYQSVQIEPGSSLIFESEAAIEFMRKINNEQSH